MNLHSTHLLASVFLVLCFVIGSNSTYNSNEEIGYSVLLTKAAQEYGAVCLDGSPGRYYFSSSSTNASTSTKYLIFFQGGGWCNGIYKKNMKGGNSCSSRINSSLGTTIHDSNQVNLNNIGFLTNNKSISPMMYNWNKIYIRYCDGGSYSGNLNNPISYINPDTKTNSLMYFRGKRIIDAIFNDLINNKNMLNATDIVIGGGSAGGLSVYLHSNYIAKKYFNYNYNSTNNKNIIPKIVALPDVGFFMEYNGYNKTYLTNYTNGMKWIFENMNISGSIIAPNCFNNYNNNEKWQCIFPHNIANNFIMDAFILNSQYDSYQATDILGTGTKIPKILNEYGKNFTNIVMKKFFDYSKRNINGLISGRYGGYIDGCYHHDATNPIYWYGLNIDGYTQAQAFQEFYQNSNGKRVWYQNVTYPCTSCCPS